MFYGALVLSKKGPLAKVWLAAHWDKKLTKAHVFETDVESTVDSIISPQMKLALRTSGHLLLGVVRIYSRKQKYLLHDLGEACAKIKMAFRPDIVDLPSNGVENADAITLPEVFHDFEIFENAVANLETMEIEAQYTVNPSRVSEITMADDPTATTGSGNLFGGEFDGYDLKGGEFEHGMEDIEVPREAETAGHKLNEVSGKDLSSKMELSDTTKAGISLADKAGISLAENKALHISTGEIPSDAANDFGGVEMLGEDGFGGDFGAGFMDLPIVPDLTIEDGGTTAAKASKDVPVESDPAPMEVDPPQQEQPSAGDAQKEDSSLNQDNTAQDNTLLNGTEEEVFVLEPVETTGVERRTKKKRKLVVDTDKEFTGQQIKSQFDDFKDLLQPKCFPPPTKKAMLWKEMAGCDQLYSHPTFPALGDYIVELITSNYSMSGEPAAEPLDMADVTGMESLGGETTLEELPPPPPPQEEAPAAAKEAEVVEHGAPAAEEQPSNELFEDLGMGGETMGMEPPPLLPEEEDLPEEEPATAKSATETDVDFDAQGTEEQQGNELSEDFEQRRWTKRTQQVLANLQKKLSASDEVYFSSLTAKCNRKQAASRFYTCLLLVKEGMITVTQAEPYADIRLQKGPKYME